jgi:hypothetical protein
MNEDYKDTAFQASQMLTRISSFLHHNKGIVIGLGITEKEVVNMAEKLMDDVRALYKESK